MSNAAGMPARERASRRPPAAGALPVDDWVARLSATGRVREEAVARLHELMLRAARHQVSRMPDAMGFGVSGREEIVRSAADEATVSVLARLATFEGRSRFTTWAYKFGIIHTLVEVRRAAWRGREIPLRDVEEMSETPTLAPEAHAEGVDLARAVRAAMLEELTPHQRRVAVALLIDEIPIDVLAERLGTTRSALYKTLHDARKRLRAHLAAQGYLSPETAKEVNR